MLITEQHKERVADILFNGYGEYDYVAHLMRLISRADEDNRERLSMAYPKEVEYVYGMKRRWASMYL